MHGYSVVSNIVPFVVPNVSKITIPLRMNSTVVHDLGHSRLTLTLPSYDVHF